MRRRVATAMFVYGCLSSIISLVWLSAALLSVNIHSIKLWLVESLFVFHGCVLVLTFHRNPGTVMWPPVLRITSQRTRAAKVILMLVAANVFVWLIAIFVLVVRNEMPWAEWVLLPFLASCSLLSTVYIALHWGFRPENLFPRAFLKFAGNPFGVIMRKLVR